MIGRYFFVAKMFFCRKYPWGPLGICGKKLFLRQEKVPPDMITSSNNCLFTERIRTKMLISYAQI